MASEKKVVSKSIVYLVGAGPGNVDLLTVKAMRLLQCAHVVIYDRLISQEILNLILPTAIREFAGKQAGKHFLTQDEINQLLVKYAQEEWNPPCLSPKRDTTQETCVVRFDGKTAKCTEQQRIIVRLKGGDPFIFGRGSEEAQYLKKHNVQFEPVPGITAAAGCSAYAGIPLTHRGLANSVLYITGQARDNTGKTNYDWSRLVRDDCTFALYMGMDVISSICEELIAAGMSPTMPAAAIQSGTTHKQRRVIATISTLSDQITREELVAPVLIIVGRVVNLAETLDWFDPASDISSV